MCKFIKPTVPQGATADERRAVYFDALYSLDMNDKVEKRENLSYLSWANAWAEFKRACPSATYRIVKDPITNLPYFADERIGIIVYTEVTADDVTHEMWLPVMNTSNKAMKLEPYTYKVFDKFKKEYVERTVEAASMLTSTRLSCVVWSKTWQCSGLDFTSTQEKIYLIKWRMIMPLRKKLYRNNQREQERAGLSNNP